MTMPALVSFKWKRWEMAIQLSCKPYRKAYLPILTFVLTLRPKSDVETIPSSVSLAVYGATGRLATSSGATNLMAGTSGPISRPPTESAQWQLLHLWNTPGAQTGTPRSSLGPALAPLGLLALPSRCLPVATPEPAPAAKFAPEASGPAAATAQPSIPTTTIHSGHSLHSLVEKFRAGSGHLSASTREKFDSHFNVLARYLNFDLEVTSIKLADMRELKSKLSEGRKPSSVNDILFKALSALFQIAVEDGILTESPLAKLKRAKKGETERQQPTWEQAERIVAEVATKARESSLIVNLMRNFGVGQAEIEQLRGEHFDLAKGLVHFRRKKTGKFFDVPIFPHSKALVEELKNKGRLGVGRPVVEWREPRAALAAACRRLEFPVYGPRGLRRCFIIHALEIGVDPRVVARWQGHKDATLILKVYGKYIDPAHELRQAQKMVTSTNSAAVISAPETNKNDDEPPP